MCRGEAKFIIFFTFSKNLTDANQYIIDNLHAKKVEFSGSNLQIKIEKLSKLVAGGRAISWRVAPPGREKKFQISESIESLAMIQKFVQKPPGAGACKLFPRLKLTIIHIFFSETSFFLPYYRGSGKVAKGLVT